jgi:hypothetical protein
MTEGGVEEAAARGGPARQAAKVASLAKVGLYAPPAFADPPNLPN